VDRLVGAQFGVVSRRQLQLCGLSDTAIARRVKAGRLIRLHRGVYAVGHTVLRPEGHRLAAVLACGPHGALSHRSAGEHRGLMRVDAASRHTVTVPRDGGRGPAGVRVFVAALPPHDVTLHRGIPTTTVARTALDVAASLGARAVGDLLDQARHLEVYDRTELDRQVATARPGAAALRRALADAHPDGHRTVSDLERLALRFTREHGLPHAEVNAWLPDLRNRVDLLWRAARLAVELDGYAWHRGRAAFEHDRHQTAELQSAGYTALRFTWRQVERRPDWVVRHIRVALGR
jgi:very-short-patch-repair endonuclease